MRVTVTALLWLLCVLWRFDFLIAEEQEAIQSVEVDVDGTGTGTTGDRDDGDRDDGSTGDRDDDAKNKVKHPNSLEVIFENQSGKTVELYWDDGSDGVIQSTLETTNEITINTFLGHRFYFTPKDSNGSKEHKLYEATMDDYTALITLYDERTMAERGAEFERAKHQWMKAYKDRTGRRWANYYPREPVTHHYYNATETGQTFTVTSARTHFTVCAPEQLAQADLDQLTALETEWNDNPKNALPAKCQEEEHQDDDACHKLPPGFQMENNRFYIGKMNDTIYCRPKVDDAEADGSGHGNGGNLTHEIVNICAHGPRAFRVLDFLSEDEMEHIKLVGQFLGLKRSTVSEEALETQDRTSQTAWIERDKSFVIDNVIRRIADIIQIDERILFLNQSAESLQLVHYFGGELYKSHVDYGTDRPHNRYITFLMYLSDVPEGGNTSFPKADKQCQDNNGYFGNQPAKGSVMFFYNLFPDGNVDTLTQHYAEPPVDSEKWMTNLWIWDRVFTR